MRQLHAEISRVRRHGLDLAVVILDADRFKTLNDRHGHLAGDACLTEVAAVLASHARTGDQVFRWGGDEFAVLLPATTPEHAALVFERLEAAVADVTDPAGSPLTITFGWAIGDAETDLRTLTEQADAALLERKPEPLAPAGTLQR
jgi:two-component system, cell cycle response regulator